MATFLFIGISICLGVTGQLVLKRGMMALGEQTVSPANIIDIIARIAFSPWVIAGLGIYVIGTFFWLMVLSRIDLSLAYPMTAMSYILIVLSSWYFLGETISMFRIAGLVTIVGGVILLAQS